jgi:FtsP/CotA-like multicopper oxidase with cupredoxin domain
MNSIVKKYRGRAVGLAVLLLILLPVDADAIINGVTATTFDLTASAGYISTAEGNSVYMWGYGITGSTVQYPGPTMIVNQGDTVTVNLTNDLSVPVSIVFPGHQAVPTGGTVGLLTSEAAPSGGTVSYTFTAAEAGTYMYHGGTQQDMHIEMGLVGAIIVRPTGYNAVSNRIAYEHADSDYDHEYLFLLTEMDVYIHEMVEFGMMDQVDTAAFYPVYWFINGRTAPDTMVAAGATWLPTQPYNCMPRMRPGEKLLMRFVVAGRDLHPFDAPWGKTPHAFCCGRQRPAPISHSWEQLLDNSQGWENA